MAKGLTPAEIGERAAARDEEEIKRAAGAAAEAMVILHKHHLEVTDYGVKNGHVYEVEVENLETFEKAWIRVGRLSNLERKANAPKGQFWSEELQQYVTIPKD